MEKERIKILMAAHIGKPWGGISTLFEAILQTPLREQFDITFFETSLTRETAADGNISSSSLLHSVRILFSFVEKLIAVRPGIVHIATAHKGSFIKHGAMVIIAKIFNKKVILAPHCSLAALLPKKSSKSWRGWVKFIIARCDCLLVLSKEWLKEDPLIRPRQLIYLPNAINTNEYSQIDRSAARASKKIKLLYLGHLSEEKGLFDLIDALTLLQEKSSIGLDLVGDPVSQSELERLIRYIALKNLLSVVNVFKAEFREQKIDRYRKADIFVLPSHHEGLPMTILEAMASGLSVIATRVGGIPDLVDDEVDGILASDHSPQELANAIHRLINDAALRKKMANAARQKACDQYDILPYVDKLGDIYHRIAMQ